VVKYLILVLAVVLLLWMLLGRQRRPPTRNDDVPRRTPPPAESAETMVECAHCGVHLPRGEAQLASGKPYCCDAHRIAGPRRAQS
jgi:uncharacterized protein